MFRKQIQLALTLGTPFLLLTLVLTLAQAMNPAGPYQVKDINSGPGSSSLDGLTDGDSILYFRATDGSTGIELWRSDGTLTGTQIVSDIAPGPSTGLPQFFFIGTKANGILYFQANDGSHGFEWWRTDGTLTGTHLISDINPGPVGNSFSASPIDVDGTLYFPADDGSRGTELWRSDGTLTGTHLVSDINPGSGSSLPAPLISWNGRLYFRANDGSRGTELWQSDGTVTGTQIVSDINPGSGSSSPYYIISMNDKLYFRANDGSRGAELWQSDGTVTGTQIVSDINPGSGSSFPFDLTIVNGALYFGADDGSRGFEVWRSDGTLTGTQIVSDINLGSSGSLSAIFLLVNNTLYFPANDGIHGIELWRSDGTLTGTRLVSDINPGPASSDPYTKTNVNNLFFFGADDGNSGRELWQSDGTLTGTRLVSDINPGPASSEPDELTNVNGTLYFSADEGNSGRELWAFKVSTNLVLVKSANKSISSAGERITYTIVALNKGSGDASNILISDTLPASLTLAGPVSLEPPEVGDVGTFPVLASNVTISAGQAITLTFPVTVNTSLTPGAIITNTASLSSPEVTTPVVGTAVITIGEEPPPTLILTKSANSTVPQAGERITYTITLSNHGSAHLNNALISDTLPASLTLAGPVSLDPPGAGVAGAPPTLASSLTISAGQRITLTFPVTVNASLATGTIITNVAAVTSAEVVTPIFGQVVIIVNGRLNYLPVILKNR